MLLKCINIFTRMGLYIPAASIVPVFLLIFRSICLHITASRRQPPSESEISKKDHSAHIHPSEKYTNNGPEQPRTRLKDQAVAHVCAEGRHRKHTNVYQKENCYDVHVHQEEVVLRSIQGRDELRM